MYKENNKHDQNFQETRNYIKSANLTIEGVEGEIKSEGMENIFCGIIAESF